MTEIKPPRGRIDTGALRKFLESDAAEVMLRRELIEGAEIEAGQQALILTDTKPSDVADLEIQTIEAMLKELGCTVRVLRVEDLLPPRPGSAPISFVNVSHRHLPRVVMDAVRDSDVTFNLTGRSRGGQRYNVDLYTLSRYYAKHIDGGRTVEAPEVLGSGPDGGTNLEAMMYPCDLVRDIADCVNELLFAAAENQEEFHLTNPWGTDLRFTVLPGDISQQQGGIREYPHQPHMFFGEDSGRLYRALAGFNVPQTCDGTWVTKYISVIGGILSEPVRLTLRDGSPVNIEGGEDAQRLREVLADENVTAHAILLGLHPKARPFRNGQYIYDNSGAAAGCCHIGIGSPGLFYKQGRWGPLGNKHFELGDIPKISLWAGKNQVLDRGRLLVLDNPRLREKAKQYGNPDELLRQFDWPPDVPTNY